MKDNSALTAPRIYQDLSTRIMHVWLKVMQCDAFGLWLLHSQELLRSWKRWDLFAQVKCDSVQCLSIALCIVMQSCEMVGDMKIRFTVASHAFTTLRWIREFVVSMVSTVLPSFQFRRIRTSFTEQMDGRASHGFGDQCHIVNNEV